MKKLTSVIFCLILWSGFAAAEPVIDEDTVRGISAEFSAAIETADIATFRKYLHPTTRIIVDLDPSNSAGEMEIGYDDYMGMMEMALPMMQGSDIQEEVIAITVDEANNRATLKEKTTALMDVMGVKLKDVSISETTFGIIDGEIKVIVAKDQLISSGPVE